MMSREGTVILVVCLYFVSLVVIGILSAKRNKSATDFVVASRGVNMIATGLTLAAVQIGVGIVLGGAGNGYRTGVWPGMYYALGCGGGLIIAGLLTASKLRAQNGFVPMDFFSQRFGDSKGVRLWAWFSNIPSLLGIFTAQMMACAGILSGFGMSFTFALWLSVGIVLFYCTIGGMWAVVFTDIILTIVIVIGIPLLCAATIAAFIPDGGDVGALFAQPFIPEGLGTRFIYLVLPFFLSISVSYDAYMRIQAAKNAKAAAGGCIIGGVITIFVGLMCSVIGAAGSRLFPGVTDGSFTVITNGVTSPVMAGIVIAAVLAAGMSSATGLLVGIGASFSRDFYNKVLHPEAEFDSLPYSKIISMCGVVFGCLVGAFFAFRLSDLLDAMIIFNYPYMGSLLIPLLGGLLWKGATRRGAFAAIAVGGVIGVGAFVVGIGGPFSDVVNSDLGLFIAYTVSLTVMVVVSLADKAGQRENELRRAEAGATE